MCMLHQVYCHALSVDAASADPLELERAKRLAAAAKAAGVQLIVYNRCVCSCVLHDLHAAISSPSDCPQPVCVCVCVCVCVSQPCLQFWWQGQGPWHQSGRTEESH